MSVIIEYIRKKGTISYPRPGCVLSGSMAHQYCCYFFESGLAALYGMNNAKPLSLVSEPQLLGLSHLFHPHSELTLKIIHPSVIYAVPSSSLFHVINEGNLWSNVASHLSQQIYDISSRTEKNKKKHASGLIGQTLKMLQNESEEVRLTHTASEYVREITGLSCSTVNRELHLLKKQGDINVQNGLLLGCYLDG